MTLNLEYNEIGDQGAQYLAMALQQNKVKEPEPLFFTFSH
jgi:hypothetical protein